MDSQLKLVGKLDPCITQIKFWLKTNSSPIQFRIGSGNPNTPKATQQSHFLGKEIDPSGDPKESSYNPRWANVKSRPLKTVRGRASLSYPLYANRTSPSCFSLSTPPPSLLQMAFLSQQLQRFFLTTLNCASNLKATKKNNSVALKERARCCSAIAIDAPSSLSGVAGIRWGLSLLQGPREEIEDDAVVRSDGLDGFSFAAVFDGHAGFSSVKFLRWVSNEQKLLFLCLAQAYCFFQCGWCRVLRDLFTLFSFSFFPLIEKESSDHFHGISFCNHGHGNLGFAFLLVPSLLLLYGKRMRVVLPFSMEKERGLFFEDMAMGIIGSYA